MPATIEDAPEFTAADFEEPTQAPEFTAADFETKPVEFTAADFAEPRPTATISATPEPTFQRQLHDVKTKVREFLSPIIGATDAEILRMRADFGAPSRDQMSDEQFFIEKPQAEIQLRGKLLSLVHNSFKSSFPEIRAQVDEHGRLSNASEFIPFSRNLSPETQKTINAIGMAATQPTSRAGSTIQKLEAGTVNALADFVQPMISSPGGIATLGVAGLPRLAQRLIALGFGAQMAANAPEQAKLAGDASGRGDTAEATRHTLGTIASGLLAGVGGAKGVAPAAKPPIIQEVKNAGAPATAAALEQRLTEKETPAIPFEQAEAFAATEPSGLNLKRPEPILTPKAAEIKATGEMVDLLAEQGAKAEDVTLPANAVRAVFDNAGGEVGMIRPTRKLSALAKAEGTVIPPSGEVLVTPRQGRFVVDETGAVLEVDNPASVTPRELATIKQFALLPENAVALSEKINDQQKNTIYIDAQGRAKIGPFGEEPTGSRPVNLTLAERIEIEREAETQSRIEQLLAEKIQKPADVSRQTIEESLPERTPLTPEESELIATQFRQRVPSEAARGETSFDRPAYPQIRTEPVTMPQEPTPPSQPTGLIAGSQLELWAQKTITEGRKRTFTGLDPELMFAYSIKGAAILERGITNAAEWSAAMIREHGPEIRPYLRKVRQESERLRAIQFQNAGGSIGLENQPRTEQAALPQSLRMTGQSDVPPVIPATGSEPRMPSMFRRPAEWGGESTLRQAGLPELADALRVWEDFGSATESRLLGGFEKLQQRFAAGEMKRAKTEAQEYIRLRERGFKSESERAQNHTEAEAYREKASAAGRDLIQWMRETAEATGDLATELKIQVRTSDGEIRPLRDLGADHFPRMLNERTREILRDPLAPENLAEYEQLKREMVENGNAPSLGEADAMLRKEWSEKTGGPFEGNVEMARGFRLPDRYYETSVDGYLNFLARFSKRAAEIKAFGQAIGESKDLFTKAMEKTRQDKLKSYVGRLRKAIYQEHANDPVIKRIQDLRVASGLAFLSGPFTAARNLVSAISSTAETFGTANTFIESTKALIDSAAATISTAGNIAKGEFKTVTPQIIQRANELGAVKRDLFASMLMDVHPDGTVKTAAKYGLWMNSAAERLGRSINAAAALTWFRNAREIITGQPESYAAKTRLATLKRLGFDGEKLDALLSNDPEALAAFARSAVREKQYGYTSSQAPLILDHEYGKLFSQFMKWGAMRLRDLDRNIIKPATSGEVMRNGEKVRDFGPLVRFALLAMGAGELLQEARSGLSGRERKDASIEEIVTTFAENKSHAINLALERIAADVTMQGGLGLVGDTVERAKQFLKRGEASDAFTAPGITILSSIAKLASSRFQRGEPVEGLGRDIEELLLTFPLPNQTQKPVLEALSALGIAETKARVLEAKNDLSFARSLARRYTEETGKGSKTPFILTIKNQNSEEFADMQEALLIGDTESAIRIKNEFTGKPGTPEYREKLKRLKSSVSARKPIKGDKEFTQWMQRRVPTQASRLLELEETYEATAKKAGLK